MTDMPSSGRDTADAFLVIVTVTGWYRNAVGAGITSVHPPSGPGNVARSGAADAAMVDVRPRVGAGDPDLASASAHGSAETL
jgi:hypothetical protein